MWYQGDTGVSARVYEGSFSPRASENPPGPGYNLSSPKYSQVIHR